MRRAEGARAKNETIERELAAVRATLAAMRPPGAELSRDGAGVVSMERAAELLEATPGEVRRMRSRGDLSMVPVGGVVMVPMSEVRRVATGVDPDVFRRRLARAKS
jgi:hypothetical protein